MRAKIPAMIACKTLLTYIPGFRRSSRRQKMQKRARTQNLAPADVEWIKKRIEYLRKKLLVHSIIYYRLDENLISDEKWAEWALELEQLTKEYPHIAQNIFLAKEFKDFDHSTGYNLPLETPWAVQKAMDLVEYYKKHGWKG
jgi:hypothetical protein